jgi:hypothetical protein
LRCLPLQLYLYGSSDDKHPFQSFERSAAMERLERLKLLASVPPFNIRGRQYKCFHSY